jgi:hypothetical protein
MVPFAFMAQHVWEVGASVFALTVIVRALALLIRGTNDPDAGWLSAKGVRVAGGLLLLLGGGIALAAFLVDAEQPGAHSRDHWGGAPGVAILGVWVVLMIGFSVLDFKRSSRGAR